MSAFSSKDYHETRSTDRPPKESEEKSESASEDYAHDGNSKRDLQFLYEVVVRVSDASDRADDEADYRTSARDERRWRDGYSRARWLSQKWRKRYASQKVAEDEKRDGVCAEPD